MDRVNIADNFVILCGDAIEALTTLPTQVMSCCVTSPPFYNLRDYGTARWEGGNDPFCDHLSKTRVRNDIDRAILAVRAGSHGELKQRPFAGTCGKCGATSTD